MNNTNKIMLQVLLAMIPAFIVKNIFWGWSSLLLLLTSLLTAAVSETIIAILRGKKPLSEFGNFSASVTCMILVLSLPPNIPYYVIIICTIMAIVIAKQIYGGMGQNIFNPAMVGVAVFLVTYPQFITYWSLPDTKVFNHLGHAISNFTGQQPLDAYTQATPLTQIKTLLQVEGNENSLGQLLQITAEHYYAWLVYALAFAMGGIFLFIRRIIDLTLPFITLAVFVSLSLVHYLLTGYAQANPIYSLIYGSIIFGAFFIVTDPVTAPQFGAGRIIYAILIGALAYIIRAFTNYNDGIAFAVLLANILVPVLDQYIRPKEFGK